MAHWTDQIVGARMAVDEAFASEVANAGISRQEWGLIMTSVEFEIERPEEPGEATLVADAALESIGPALEGLAAERSPLEGGERSDDGGVIATIRSALGLADEEAGGLDEGQLEAAQELTRAYASRLQRRLESQDRWAAICGRAAE